MRKWISLILLCLIFLITAVYALIPNVITVRESLQMQVNAEGFSRNILDVATWEKWWPGKVDSSATEKSAGRFVFNGNRYTVVKNQLTSHLIVTQFGNNSLRSRFFFIPTSNDSVQIVWEGAIGASYFPIKRFLRYKAIKNLQDDWKTILQRLKTFFSKEENLYGLMITKELVRDTALISTAVETSVEPSVDIVYRLIDQLKDFAAKKGVLHTGLPMLNVSQKKDDRQQIFYRIQVALPVKKILQNEGSIKFQRMVKGGFILVAEVKGGLNTIAAGFEKMENYINDNNRVAPAIPFQSLVTDRRMEKDTTKWITKLCYPVI